MGIDARLVLERCTQLGITDEEFFDATGTYPGAIEQGKAADEVSIGLLTRIAALLYLLPSDLVADLSAPSSLDLADLMLLEFALNNGPRHPAGLHRLLGWSRYRLNLTLTTVRISPTSSTHTLGTLDEWWLVLEPTENGPYPYDRERYALWLGTRTAPDPFDATALLRVLRAWLWEPAGSHAGFASPATARRLAARRLAVAADALASAPHVLAENDFEVPVQPHPDLLFALGLGAAPEPHRDGDAATHGATD